MANDIAATPYLLDTAGVIVATAGVLIKTMVWEGPLAAGDRICVKDGSGRVVWDYTALAGDSNGRINYTCPAQNFAMRGMILDTLGSGRLRVYLG